MTRIEYIVKGDNLTGLAQHDHKTWEFMYCVEGEVTIKYGDKSLVYSAKHGVLIPPYIKHSNIANTDKVVLIRAVFDTDSKKDQYSAPLYLDDSVDGDLGCLLEMYSKYFAYGPLRQNPQILDSYSLLISDRLVELIKFSNKSQMVLDIAKEIVACSKDPDYSLDTTFDKYTLSKDYVRRQFIKEQDISPIQFLTNIRISHAMNLLKTRYLNNMKINEIALESGFTDQLYFSRVFHKVVGCSPREYSEQQNEDIED